MKAGLVAGVGLFGLTGVSSVKDSQGSSEMANTNIESIGEHIGEKVKVKFGNGYDTGTIRLSFSHPKDSFYLDCFNDNPCASATFKGWHRNMNKYGVLDGEIVRRVA